MWEPRPVLCVECRYLLFFPRGVVFLCFFLFFFFLSVDHYLVNFLPPLLVSYLFPPFLVFVGAPYCGFFFVFLPVCMHARAKLLFYLLVCSPLVAVLLQ